jgi:hypothetical protein
MSVHVYNCRELFLSINVIVGLIVILIGRKEWTPPRFRGLFGWLGLSLMSQGAIQLIRSINPATYASNVIDWLSILTLLSSIIAIVSFMMSARREPQLHLSHETDGEAWPQTPKASDTDNSDTSNTNS